MIEHVIVPPSNSNYPNMPAQPAPPADYYASNPSSQSDSTWPSQPMHLNASEESSLQSDLARKLAYYSSEQLKGFFNDLTKYDPSMAGFAHHSYVSMAAMRNGVSIVPKLEVSYILAFLNIFFFSSISVANRRQTIELCDAQVRVAQPAERIR